MHHLAHEYLYFLSTQSQEPEWSLLLLTPLLSCSYLFSPFYFNFIYTVLLVPLNRMYTWIGEKSSVVRCIRYNDHELKPPRTNTSLLGNRSIKPIPPCSCTRGKEMLTLCCQVNPRDTIEKGARLKSMMIFPVDNFWWQTVWTSFCLDEHDWERLFYVILC